MYDSIEQIIAEKGIYTGLTRGTSMWPLIHQGRDNIIIVRPRGRLKKYDVPVYRTPGGKYIMHRIVRVRPEDYVIIGDNRLQRNMLRTTAFAACWPGSIRTESDMWTAKTVAATGCTAGCGWHCTRCAR